MATSGVFDPARGWEEQIDRGVVLGLLEEWLPEQLQSLGFDALWTPKRLLERLREGEIDRQAAIEVLARYPYLQIPPTPLWEQEADVPREGSWTDVELAEMRRQVDDDFYGDVQDLEDRLEGR